MSGYENFKQDIHDRQKADSQSNHKVVFNSSVKAKGLEEQSALEKNQDKYKKFLSWSRWFPDLFLDLIKPKKGGINLHSDQRTFMRVAVRFASMYGVYPRGWGKCVAGDSILFTEDGMKEIGSYFDYMKSDGDFYIPSNIRLLNKNGELESTIAGVSSGLRDTKTIKTEEGYEIQASLKHPLLVMNSNGNVEWKKSKDIQIGDCLLISRNNDIWGKNNVSNFEIEDFLSKCDKPDEEIPKCIMESNKKTVVTFIQRLFKFCGKISDGYIELNVKSEKMSKQLQIILLNFGVISVRCFNGEDDSYTLKVHDVIPYQVNKDYFYSKVKSIEDGKEYVYDLSLLDTHSFISNGFVSHNTFNEVIVMYIMCVLYPGIEFALTAQTKENAAELLKDKHSDIVKKYPWFKNEVFDTSFTKSDAEIVFLNDSKIDILANNQSSKGQRRNQIMIEESALLDDFTFQDALFPIVEHGRLTVGELGILNPEELNQKVNFFTTAGFRGSDEFERSLRMKDDMVNLTGKMVMGSDWHLGCWYGRGSTKKQILDKKKNMSPVAFAQNYESKWSGAAGNALVDIKKVINLRTLAIPEIKGDGISEYYVSMDVARSIKASNNQSSIAVLKVLRNKTTHRVDKIQLVNLIYIPNFLNFTAQSIAFKRVKYLYNAKIAIVDENGLGKGMKDELLKEQKDMLTGNSYPCWDTINTEDEPENDIDADKCLFALASQGINTDIIVSFIDTIESKRLELLKKHKESYDTEDRNYVDNVVAPMVQTDLLIEELSNLQLQHLSNGGLNVKQLTKRVDKDRYSALAYGIYYILRYENSAIQEDTDIDISALFSTFKQPKIR